MVLEDIQLSDIDLSVLRPIRELVLRIGNQDHGRWIFRSPRDSRLLNGRDVYLKIWNPTYIRRDNLLRGIDTGLYDQHTVPALRGLIRSNGLCRGYIMERCRENNRLDDEFYHLIKAKTCTSSCFHVQFSPYHTMRFRQTFSLVDLEGVYRIADLPRMPSLHCRFDWPDYERFVAELYRRTFGPTRRMPLAGHAAPATGGRLPRNARFPYRKGRALLNHLRRWRTSEFGVAMSYTHLIET